MKYFSFVFLFVVVLVGCQRTVELSSINPVNWNSRLANQNSYTDAQFGKSYLPVYSQIYQLNTKRIHDLTITVSIRNLSLSDTMYILKAEYFDSKGDFIRSYFQHPVYVKPLETIEIVIDELDNAGGTGAKFLFDWAVKKQNIAPLFQAIMISTSGQQGLSFVTEGMQLPTQ